MLPNNYLFGTYPLGTILFQFFFLLVAIALEALVFQKRLHLSQKASVTNATFLNLFATVVGWIVFFILEPMLPPATKYRLLNYIFFNNLDIANGSQFAFLLVFVVFFFANFILKIIGFQLLQLIMKEPDKEDKTAKSLPRRQLRRNYLWQAHDRGGATAVLFANACSYIAILLIIFICSREHSFI
jgi:hypothetical protein